MRIQWFVQAMPSCCGAARRYINSEFPYNDAIHLKWTRAIMMELWWKGTIEALLKHFESDFFVVEEVYTIETTYEYREAFKASFKAQAQSGPGELSTIL